MITILICSVDAPEPLRLTFEGASQGGSTLASAKRTAETLATANEVYAVRVWLNDELQWSWGGE